MTTTDKFQYKAFAAKLSAFRAGLNADEQELLDDMVTSTDVEAHAAKQFKFAPKVSSEKAYSATEGEEVEAHAMGSRVNPKVSSEKAYSAKDGDVEAHALMPKVASSKEESEDVEAHAKVAGKVAASKFAYRYNAARASYEIGDDADEDVEAHARQMPRPSEVARS